jgi:predicted lactoylglutathione lyase
MDLGWFELSLDVQDIKRSGDFYAQLGLQLVDNAPEPRIATFRRGDCRICFCQNYPHH